MGWLTESWLTLAATEWKWSIISPFPLQSLHISSTVHYSFVLSEIVSPAKFSQRLGIRSSTYGRNNSKCVVKYQAMQVGIRKYGSFVLDMPIKSRKSNDTIHPSRSSGTVTAGKCLLFFPY